MRKNWVKKGISSVLALVLPFTAAISIGTHDVEASQFTDSNYNINMSYFDSNEMEISNGYSNGSMFDCMWRSGNVAFSNNTTSLSITRDTDSGSGYNYAGAEYRTQQTFRYGYYEVTMKPIRNTGVVSSFFTYTGPTDGTVWDEIDIEFLGKDTTKVQFNYYTNGVGGHEYLYSLGFDAAADFHTYGFDWQPGYITWYVDGNKVYTPTSNIPSTPGKIMMNVWPGRGVDDWLGAFNGATTLTAQYKAASYSKTAPGSSAKPSTPPSYSSDGSGVFVEAENYANMSGVQKEACREGGQNVGYIDTYDWMSYDNVELPVSGKYLVEFRVASTSNAGILRLEQNSGSTNLGEVSIPNTGDWQDWTTVSMTVDLRAGNQNFGIASPVGGYNLNWIKFTPVKNAAEKPVILVEAENYANMSGVQKEACSEGGQNVGYIDTYDWMSYDNVEIPVTGRYLVEFRVASTNNAGILRLEQNAGNTNLGEVSIPNTGDWQNWTTVSMIVNLQAGNQSFGIASPVGGYNLNWIKFTLV